MNLSDEFNRLAELHDRGVLSDDEFVQAKARVLRVESAHAGEAPIVGAINALRRSREDRWIAGVCGGVARSTGIESWVWRLMFAALLLFGGVGLLLYVLFWIFIPNE